MQLNELIQTYGYAAVAVGTFLEGESVLLLAGAAAFHGQLSLPVVIAVATVASFFGDQLFFLIGRRFGPSLIARYPGIEPRINRFNQLIERFHQPLILSIRFLYGLRIAGPIAVGMSRVPWFSFLSLNLVGAVIWATLIAYLGQGAGQVVATIYQQVTAQGILHLVDVDGAVGIAILALSLLAVLILHARRRVVSQ